MAAKKLKIPKKRPTKIQKKAKVKSDGLYFRFECFDFVRYLRILWTGSRYMGFSRPVLRIFQPDTFDVEMCVENKIPDY